MHPTDTACPLRVVVVDDHPAVRHGVAQLLAAGGHHMAGEAETRQELLPLLRQGGIDLVLLDLSLDGGSGFDLLADLSESEVPALIYSMHEDPETIDQALRWGARGYVTKCEKPKVLLLAVAEVAAGRRFLSPRATRSLAEGPPVPPPADLEQGLSEREHQILLLLGQGETRQEIAAALGIGPRTVETYCLRLIQKRGLANMNALRKYAISRHVKA